MVFVYLLGHFVQLIFNYPIFQVLLSFNSQNFYLMNMHAWFQVCIDCCSAVTALQHLFQSLHHVCAGLPNCYPHSNEFFIVQHSPASHFCQLVIFKATNWRGEACWRRTASASHLTLSMSEPPGSKTIPKPGPQGQCNSKVLIIISELFQRFWGQELWWSKLFNLQRLLRGMAIQWCVDFVWGPWFYTIVFSRTLQSILLSCWERLWFVFRRFICLLS